MTGTIRHLSTGQMYDESREIFIEIDPHLPSPQNRTQTHVYQVVPEQIKHLTDVELDYIMTRTKQCTYFPHGKDGMENIPWLERTKATANYRKYISRLRVEMSSQHMLDVGILGEKFERWCYKNMYNQWYIVYVLNNPIRVDLLYAWRKYTRMKKHRGTRLEINKINAEIAALQRRRKKLRQTITSTGKNGSRNNKTSFSR